MSASAWTLLPALLLVACGRPSDDAVEKDAARLRAAYSRHQDGYRRAIQSENELIKDALEWLDSPLLLQANRGAAAGPSQRMAERFSAAHVLYKVIQDDLLAVECDTAPVREAKQAILGPITSHNRTLRDDAVYLYDAARSGFNQPYSGPLPPQLVQLKSRLAARPLAALPPPVPLFRSP